MEADLDGDGKLSFEEFALTVSNTVCSPIVKLLLRPKANLYFPSQDIVKQMTLEDLF